MAPTWEELGHNQLGVVRALQAHVPVQGGTGLGRVMDGLIWMRHGTQPARWRACQAPALPSCPWSQVVSATETISSKVKVQTIDPLGEQRDRGSRGQGTIFQAFMLYICAVQAGGGTSKPLLISAGCPQAVPLRCPQCRTASARTPSPLCCCPTLSPPPPGARSR